MCHRPDGSKWTHFFMQWDLGSIDPRFHTYRVFVDCEESKHLCERRRARGFLDWYCNLDLDIRRNSPYASKLESV